MAPAQDLLGHDDRPAARTADGPDADLEEAFAALGSYLLALSRTPDPLTR